MATKIRWTDEVWNPVTGCSRVSPGCENCYAERIALRFKRTPFPWAANHTKDNVQVHRDRLIAPLKWRTPRKVFVNSMADLWHEQVSDEFIGEVFGIMSQSALAGHTFQILTKRPERMRCWFEGVREWEGFAVHGDGLPLGFGGTARIIGAWDRWPLPNVWLGVSVEDQRRADERLWDLLATPAAVHFVSLEPLLNAVDLTFVGDADYWINALTGDEHYSRSVRRGILPRLDWVILGGESGPGARPMDIDWARSVRDQCVAAQVPFFFKQTGGLRPETGVELDGRTWEQFPDPGRVRSS